MTFRGPETGPPLLLYSSLLTDLKPTMAFFQQSSGLRGGLAVDPSFVTWAWSSARITLYPAI